MSICELNPWLYKNSRKRRKLIGSYDYEWGWHLVQLQCGNTLPPCHSDHLALANQLHHFELVSLMQSIQIDLKASSFPSRPLKDNEKARRSLSHLVAASMSGKAPKFSMFNGEGLQKMDISFVQWAFKVCIGLADYSKAALEESIVRSLRGVTANLMWYMSPYVPVSQMVNKL